MKNFTEVRAHRFRQERAANLVAAFVANNEAALWYAARRLGGYEAARLVDRLSETLRRECRLTSTVRTMLNQIESLLTLQNVHDPDQTQMGYFVTIDPADPVVEEICLLADGLSRVLEQANTFGRDHAAAPGFRTAA